MEDKLKKFISAFGVVLVSLLIIYLGIAPITTGIPAQERLNWVFIEAMLSISFISAVIFVMLPLPILLGVYSALIQLAFIEIEKYSFLGMTFNIIDLIDPVVIFVLVTSLKFAVDKIFKFK